jgi:hypothetical protein
MGDLRYPIGKFEPPSNLGPGERGRFIEEIAAAPEQLRRAVQGLSEEQLETPYRPEGWTLRQVVHHVPDSHMNFYIRTRLALTEDEPTIRPYQEDLWAKLGDARTAPVELSLSLLEALHGRLVVILGKMEPREWRRAYIHPEKKAAVPLEVALAEYAWHGRHHTAHITTTRDRLGF